MTSSSPQICFKSFKDRKTSFSGQSLCYLELQSIFYYISTHEEKVTWSLQAGCQSPAVHSLGTLVVHCLRIFKSSTKSLQLYPWLFLNVYSCRVLRPHFSWGKKIFSKDFRFFASPWSKQWCTWEVITSKTSKNIFLINSFPVKLTGLLGVHV